MKTEDVEDIKRYYLEKKSELEGILSKESEDLDSEGDEVDLIQTGILAMTSKSLVIRDANKLSKINDALLIIERGDNINECESCMMPIGKKRLLAIPGVRLCISCAEEIEQNSR